LGLKPIFVLLLIVLPQALKAVIPAIVGQFISLFKDTSLLAIVGLVEISWVWQDRFWLIRNLSAIIQRFIYFWRLFTGFSVILCP
jgi:ABC-type amino acid transport system permease subunit